MFVCCDSVDATLQFEDSLMNKVIDKYANTITLFVTVPPPPANPKLHPDGTPKHPETTPHATPQQDQLGFQDNFVNTTAEESRENEQATEPQERGVAGEGHEARGVAAEEASSIAAGTDEEVGGADEEVDRADEGKVVDTGGGEGGSDGGGVVQEEVAATENGTPLSSGDVSDPAPSGGVSDPAPASNPAAKGPTINMEDNNRPLQRSMWLGQCGCGLSLCCHSHHHPD